VDKLYRAARRYGVTRSQVLEWLQLQPGYTLHRPARKHFRRNRVIVYGIDSQWQADLVDMQSLSRWNRGYKYLLTCIDILSKFAFVVPLKTKTGKELVAAFKKIFRQGRKPEKLQTDAGTEFKNRTFQTFLKEENVHFFVTYNETKAQVVFQQDSQAINVANVYHDQFLPLFGQTRRLGQWKLQSECAPKHQNETS